MIYDEPRARADEYAKRRRLELGEVLGFGQDGIVFATGVATAVKSLKYRQLYEKELAVYSRLLAHDIDNLCGFNVPKLVGHHDELMVIEMEFVTPPFVLDFASAGVDQDPLQKYDQGQIAETIAAWSELFGAHWPQVRKLYHALKGLGIYLTDLNTNNIRTNAAGARG